MNGYKCYRSAYKPPRVWCAETADEVKVFPIDCGALSCDEVQSAASGPDVGVRFVDGLRENEDSSNNNIEGECCAQSCYYLIVYGNDI